MMRREVRKPADDLRPQQRHHVGADRELEAGEHFLGHRGSAQDVPALEDEHLLAGAAEPNIDLVLEACGRYADLGCQGFHLGFIADQGRFNQALGRCLDRASKGHV